MVSCLSVHCDRLCICARCLLEKTDIYGILAGQLQTASSHVGTSLPACVSFLAHQNHVFTALHFVSHSCSGPPHVYRLNKFLSVDSFAIQFKVIILLQCSLFFFLPLSLSLFRGRVVRHTPWEGCQHSTVLTKDASPCILSPPMFSLIYPCQETLAHLQSVLFEM